MMRGSVGGGDMRIEFVPPKLTIEQRFRLVEIAHETSSVSIRDWALRLLDETKLARIEKIEEQF